MRVSVMKEREYISIAELAKVLGISRIAVYKKVKQGKIKAIRVGRSFAIPKDYLKENLIEISGKPLKEKDKKEIDKAVKKAVAEYGETLKLLGNE
jgi:excisionase family DNA binding protein